MKIKNDKNGRIEIYTPYNEGFVKELKRSIGGRKWDMDKNCWTAPEEALDSVRELMLKHLAKQIYLIHLKLRLLLTLAKMLNRKICVLLFLAKQSHELIQAAP